MSGSPGEPLRRRGRLLAAAVVLVLTAGPAGAQSPASADPEADLVVGVLTMGQGDLVYERFGHNAIWIHDPVARTNRVYNYGVFDFDSPGYWGRFVKGTWIYQLAVSDLGYVLDTYRYLNRTVRVQILNLTQAQARELRDFLDWNALPQNRDYLYDYYRDNCSTRVRDVLDNVLGGALGAITRGVPTGTTYRWHSERLIAGDRLSYTGLLVGLGPAADREIDAWEEMFIPFKVQDRLHEIDVDDGHGRRVPLVAREDVLVSAIDRDPELAAPPQWTHWYLLGGVAVGGLVILLGAVSPRSRAATATLAAVGGVWGLLAGVAGLLLLGLWTLTNHEIAYRNATLLQLNPLALGLLALLPALAAGSRRAVRPARGLATLLVALSLVGVVLYALPWVVQENLGIIAFALPVHVAFAWSIHRLAAVTPASAGVPAVAHPSARRGA